MATVFLDRPTVVYPDSDGQPMADNTRQYECMVTIKGGLDVLFASAPDVFVAGDHLWYPVEGHPEIRIAPDVYVAFGRPKGHRGSYKQWMEGGVAPQVVFEVLSPKNTVPEMLNKLAFYENTALRSITSTIRTAGRCSAISARAISRLPSRRCAATSARGWACGSRW